MSRFGSPVSRANPFENIKYPILNRIVSDRSSHQSQPSRPPQNSSPSKQSDSVPEVLTYMLMKEKFDQIYKRIERITVKDEVPAMLLQRRFSEKGTSLVEPEIKITNLLDSKGCSQVCKVRTSHLQGKRYAQQSNELLEVSTVSESQIAPKARASNPITHIQLMRKSKYRKRMLQPLGKTNMSNNIKDYLSVEKISLKEIEESLLSKSKIVKEYQLNQLLSKTEAESHSPIRFPRASYNSTHVHTEPSPTKQPKRPVKFNPPFDLYYYRDFIWKISFSNQLLMAPVQQYETRVKYYVGPGNNSNLIKGIMNRRPWFQLTDKMADAQFVWTQIKIAGLFQGQKKGIKVEKISEEDRQRVEEIRQGRFDADILECRILNELQNQQWERYWSKHLQKQRKMKESMALRSKMFALTPTPPRPQLIHNHFCNNFILGNKKALLQTMSEYYNSIGKEVFSSLPLTFHIKNGTEDDQYLKFLQYYYAISKSNKSQRQATNKFNAWIVKPGQFTNRGHGIIVCLQLNQIKTILKRKQKHQDGSLKTYILQKYIERPLLYRKRKFDLRHYMMINCSNNRIKGYWFKQGYVRTTSSQFSLKNAAGSVHLTNDAVQKNLPDYGKYEKGNKITYEELNNYVKKFDAKFDFWKVVYPRMKEIATDAIKAAATNVDEQRRSNFQIFGLDFMIDETYAVWLIEVNTNPCLETTCPVLNKIIPKFIENTFQICLDPLFPAPLNFALKYQQYNKNLNQENSYDLVFDQRLQSLPSLPSKPIENLPQEQEDVFDDDGVDFKEQTF